MIFVRSRRSVVTLGASGLLCALVFGGLAAGAATLPGGLVASIALGVGAAAGAVLAGWCAVRLRAWPPGRMGFFRDRLVVLQGRHEMRALWERVDTVTLGDPNAWPKVRITDRLTINFRNEASVSFKPAVFGLEPAACRDLIVRLRDDEQVRARLPEFDSARDLAVSPIVAGELIEPRL